MAPSTRFSTLARWLDLLEKERREAKVRRRETENVGETETANPTLAHSSANLYIHKWSGLCECKRSACTWISHSPKQFPTWLPLSSCLLVRKSTRTSWEPRRIALAAEKPCPITLVSSPLLRESQPMSDEHRPMRLRLFIPSPRGLRLYIERLFSWNEGAMRSRSETWKIGGYTGKNTESARVAAVAGAASGEAQSMSARRYIPGIETRKGDENGKVT